MSIYGDVLLNGSVLPGIVTGIDVSSEVKSDENSVEGSGQQVNTPVGYADDRVVITISLDTTSKSSAMDKLAQLQVIFKPSSKTLVPKKFRITNKHIQGRGIDEVYFSSFRTKETDETDVVIATCEFTKYNVIIVKVKKKEAAATTSVSDLDFSTPASNPLPKADKTPGKDVEIPPELSMLFQ